MIELGWSNSEKLFLIKIPRSYKLKLQHKTFITADILLFKILVLPKYKYKYVWYLFLFQCWNQSFSGQVLLSINCWYSSSSTRLRNSKPSFKQLSRRGVIFVCSSSSSGLPSPPATVIPSTSSGRYSVICKPIEVSAASFTITQKAPIILWASPGWKLLLRDRRFG